MILAARSGLTMKRSTFPVMQLHTYLNYGGNCEQAFRFYEEQLGGKITMLMRHGEGPTAANAPPD